MGPKPQFIEVEKEEENDHSKLKFLKIGNLEKRQSNIDHQISIKPVQLSENGQYEIRFGNSVSTGYGNVIINQPVIPEILKTENSEKFNDLNFFTVFSEEKRGFRQSWNRTDDWRSQMMLEINEMEKKKKETPLKKYK